jgi:hypothetical protein
LAFAGLKGIPDARRSWLVELAGERKNSKAWLPVAGVGVGSVLAATVRQALPSLMPAYVVFLCVAMAATFLAMVASPELRSLDRALQARGRFAKGIYAMSPDERHRSWGRVIGRILGVVLVIVGSSIGILVGWTLGGSSYALSGILGLSGFILGSLLAWIMARRAGAAIIARRSETIGPFWRGVCEGLMA